MPPKFAIHGLRILAWNQSPEDRRKLLVALNPGVPERTTLNAYMLPSLTELGLYSGTLRAGAVTRDGKIIAEAKDSKAEALMARRLIQIDAEHVGLVEWLAERASRGEIKRFALRRFIDEALGVPESDISTTLDRLGKWALYLTHFGVIRESRMSRGVIWTVNRRHLAALNKIEPEGPLDRLPSDSDQADALLAAYARASQQLATRLYLPISAVRDELGRELQNSSGTLLDEELDDILRRAPALLKDHLVSFSPFSGPAPRGGIKLENMYAGFISIRTRPSRHDSGVD